MVKTCKICNCNDQSLLFNAPKDEKRRKIWSEACEIQLTTTALICEKHFNASDFYGGKKMLNNARLKRNAVPFVNPNPTVQIKEETATKIVSDELHEPLVKIEVDNLEPLHLIHEEKFDEHNSNIVDNNEPYNLKDVAAGSENDAAKYLTCGEIVVDLENERFNLLCKYCEVKFEVNVGQTFVDHIKEFHANVISYKKPQALGAIKTRDLIIRNVEESAEDFKTELENDDINFNTNDDLHQEHEHTSDGTDEEDSKSKFKKDKKTKAEQKIKKSKKTAVLPKHEAKNSQDNLVTFETMPQKYVITFLELIKSNAILWHRRQSILKRYDETLRVVLATFNETYPKYKLNEETARMSINRIKELYQRVTDPQHKRHIKTSQHKTKFPAFFEHCQAIDENSKKIVYACDKCRAFFFTEIDLQIHKVKTHRIGELPFKCKRCGYGFTNAEKRDEHEAKHDRSRDFVCEVCNRGFNSEDKLRSHAVTHSDDVKPVCEKCGQMFSTYNKYRRHKLRHEAPKEKCNICGKLYFEKWNLSEHIKSHLNERSYYCDVCGKSFNHQNDVTIHKRGVHHIKPTPRRATWVNKDELNQATSKRGSENEQDSENVNESSDESQNVYSDNYHHFRPMF